jgi:hypothetical protein
MATTVHWRAARLYARAGQPELAKAEFARANEAGARLESFYPNPRALESRVLQLIMCDRLDEARELAKKWAKETGSSWLWSDYGEILLLQGDSQTAFNIVPSGAVADYMRSWRFIAALDLPESRAEALRWANEFSSESTAGFQALYSAVIANQLLARPKQAEEVALAFQARRPELAKAISPYNVWLVQFLAGEVGDEALLSASQGSNVNLCESHFFIGLRQLAKGDRKAAKTQFQAALDTGADNLNAYWKSWIMRNQLERNPNWPSTISAATQ